MGGRPLTCLQLVATCVFGGCWLAVSCVSLWFMPSETASRVKQQRLRRGMTQQDLADSCREAGVSVDESHISRIERGIYTPRPRLRAALADLLGLDINDFGQCPPPDEMTGSAA